MEELDCNNEQFLCASDYNASLDGNSVGDNTSGNSPDGARESEGFFSEEDEF